MNDQPSGFNEFRALAGLREGECAKVRCIEGGRRMAQRMSMIGIRPGVDVRVVHGPGRRGAVLQVGGARIALGRGVIEQIRVEVSPVMSDTADHKGDCS